MSEGQEVSFSKASTLRALRLRFEVPCRSSERAEVNIVTSYRSFIFAALAFACGTVYAGDLAERFRAPPPSARPQVWCTG